MTEPSTPADAADAAAPALAYPEPDRRHLRIFAVDPMASRLSLDTATTVSIPYEPLHEGPEGELVRVVDYDGSTGCYYSPVDLDDPRLMASDGLVPSERDPRFHQQMVYAVTSALLENFERALGRRFRWRADRRLLLMPHAFRGRNARFDPDEGSSVQFGYFTADRRDPGRNLPGQTVFSCLSHDVVVHEVAHALVHRYRKGYESPSNADVYAFHEGFADLLALFQHFTLPDLLKRHLAQSRTDLGASAPFLTLAQQFAEGAGKGTALRSALDQDPDPSALARTVEPHARGSVLVAGVFDGFLTTYRRATADLLRIASGGSGVLPQGAVHPDLTSRVAAEAQALAGRYLRMCTRAFQFLPVVDVTFGDFLRALVTADVDIDPADTHGARAALVEGCRRRGIHASEAGSLLLEAVAYPDAADRGVEDLPLEVVEPLVLVEALRLARPRGLSTHTDPTPVDAGEVAKRLHVWADRQRARLDLHADLPFSVQGFHAAFRPTASGVVHVDVVVSLLQTAREATRAHGERLGGIELQGGTTVVADATGRVRFVVTKPVPVTGGSGAVADRREARLREVLDFVDVFDGHYTAAAWSAPQERITRTLSFAAVDGAS